MPAYDPEEAQRALDATAGLTEAQKHQWQAAIDGMKNANSSDVLKRVAAEQATMYPAQRALDQRLEDLQERIADLIRQGESGRISAAEFQQSFEDLTKEQAQAEAEFEALRNQDRRLREMANDPLAYWPRLLRKFPVLRGRNYPKLP